MRRKRCATLSHPLGTNHVVAKRHNGLGVLRAKFRVPLKRQNMVAHNKTRIFTVIIRHHVSRTGRQHSDLVLMRRDELQSTRRVTADLIVTLNR